MKMNKKKDNRKFKENKNKNKDKKNQRRTFIAAALKVRCSWPVAALWLSFGCRMAAL